MKNIFQRGVKGAGGRGKRYPTSATPFLPADREFSFSSEEFVATVDLISEGPVEGFVGREGIKLENEQILNGLFLNGTPVAESFEKNTDLINDEIQNPSLAQYNFPDVFIDFRSGEEDQEVLNDFFSVPSYEEIIDVELFGVFDYDSVDPFVNVYEDLPDGSTGIIRVASGNADIRVYTVEDDDEEASLESVHGSDGVDDQVTIDYSRWRNDARSDEDEISYTHVIYNKNVKQVTPTIKIPQLFARSTAQGGIAENPNFVTVVIEVGFENEEPTEVEEYSYYSVILKEYTAELEAIDLPTHPTKNRYIRVRKKEPETDSILMQRRLQLHSVKEIFDAKFNYPSTALAGFSTSARYFDSPPSREYLMRMKKVQVPSNYNPIGADTFDKRVLKDASEATTKKLYKFSNKQLLSLGDFDFGDKDFEISFNAKFESFSTSSSDKQYLFDTEGDKVLFSGIEYRGKFSCRNESDYFILSYQDATGSFTSVSGEVTGYSNSDTLSISAGVFNDYLKLSVNSGSNSIVNVSGLISNKDDTLLNNFVIGSNAELYQTIASGSAFGSIEIKKDGARTNFYEGTVNTDNSVQNRYVIDNSGQHAVICRKGGTSVGLLVNPFCFGTSFDYVDKFIETPSPRYNKPETTFSRRFERDFYWYQLESDPGLKQTFDFAGQDQELGGPFIRQNWGRWKIPYFPSGEEQPTLFADTLPFYTGRIEDSMVEQPTYLTADIKDDSTVCFCYDLQKIYSQDVIPIKPEWTEFRMDTFKAQVSIEMFQYSLDGLYNYDGDQIGFGGGSQERAAYEFMRLGGDNAHMLNGEKTLYAESVLRYAEFKVNRENELSEINHYKIPTGIYINYLTGKAAAFGNMLFANPAMAINPVTQKPAIAFVDHKISGEFPSGNMRAVPDTGWMQTNQSPPLEPQTRVSLFGDWYFSGHVYGYSGYLTYAECTGEDIENIDDWMVMKFPVDDFELPNGGTREKFHGIGLARQIDPYWKNDLKFNSKGLPFISTSCLTRSGLQSDLAKFYINQEMVPSQNNPRNLLSYNQFVGDSSFKFLHYTGGGIDDTGNWLFATQAISGDIGGSFDFGPSYTSPNGSILINPITDNAIFTVNGPNFLVGSAGNFSAEFTGNSQSDFENVFSGSEAFFEQPLGIVPKEKIQGWKLMGIGGQSDNNLLSSAIAGNSNQHGSALRDIGGNALWNHPLSTGVRLSAPGALYSVGGNAGDASFGFATYPTGDDSISVTGVFQGFTFEESGNGSHDLNNLGFENNLNSDSTQLSGPINGFRFDDNGNYVPYIIMNKVDHVLNFGANSPAGQLNTTSTRQQIAFYQPTGNVDNLTGRSDPVLDMSTSRVWQTTRDFSRKLTKGIETEYATTHAPWTLYIVGSFPLGLDFFRRALGRPMPDSLYYNYIRNFELPKRGKVVDNRVQFFEDSNFELAPSGINIYEGDWDGTFKTAWTDNPVWVLYDLITNENYGVRSRIDDIDDINIFNFYKIGRYCDAVDESGNFVGVSDGNGGLMPRYSFNARIDASENAFQVINYIAASFFGVAYWQNGRINIYADMPRDVMATFNNSNVLDGNFEYSTIAKNEIYNMVEVLYQDRNDEYKIKAEYVEDEDSIRKIGLIKHEEQSRGFTERSLARRFGKHILYSNKLERQNVTFTVGQEALLVGPGDLIQINDELQNFAIDYGKLLEVDTTNKTIKLDETVETGAVKTGADGGAYFYAAFGQTGINELYDQVKLNDVPASMSLIDATSRSQLVQIPVTGISQEQNGYKFFLDQTSDDISALDSAELGSFVNFESVNNEPKIYSVINVVPEESNLYRVFAKEHQSGKYELIESDIDFTLDLETSGYNIGVLESEVDRPLEPQSFSFETGFNNQGSIDVTGEIVGQVAGQETSYRVSLFSPIGGYETKNFKKEDSLQTPFAFFNLTEEGEYVLQVTSLRNPESAETKEKKFVINQTIQPDYIFESIECLGNESSYNFTEASGSCVVKSRDVILDFKFPASCSYDANILDEHGEMLIEDYVTNSYSKKLKIQRAANTKKRNLTVELKLKNQGSICHEARFDIKDNIGKIENAEITQTLYLARFDVEISDPTSCDYINVYSGSYPEFEPTESNIIKKFKVESDEKFSRSIYKHDLQTGATYYKLAPVDFVGTGELYDESLLGVLGYTGRWVKEQQLETVFLGSFTGQQSGDFNFEYLSESYEKLPSGRYFVEVEGKKNAESGSMSVEFSGNGISEILSFSENWPSGEKYKSKKMIELDHSGASIFSKSMDCNFEDLSLNIKEIKCKMYRE